jgi:hypothetical protein
MGKLVTIWAVSRQRTPGRRSLALLLGLGSLLVMHVITSPPGHSAAVSVDASAASASVVVSALSSVHPAGASHHGGQGSLHGDLAQA